jgi:NADPH2:quinone reductase
MNVHTMRAAVIASFGSIDSLTVTSVPRPIPRAGEVLLRISAIGINPVDWKTVEGAGVASQVTSFPFTPGWDVAGTVAVSGPGPVMFKPGDRVMGMVNFPAGGGAFAEYVAAPVEDLVPIPDGADDVQAAAAPLVSLTAWQALFDTAGLASGERVLVHAAAGGVGHVAVQLARWKGAHVIGTASERNHGFLQSLGCAEVFSHGADDPWMAAGPVDVVLDTVGGDTRGRSLEILAPTGRLVTLLTGSSDAGLGSGDPRVSKILVHPNRESLVSIAKLIASRDLSMTTTVFTGLDSLPEALQRSRHGHTRGKIVLLLNGGA